jgi:predicted metal-dependent hydrolase
MTEVYKLLAKFAPSGFGPGHWVADEKISAPDLRQGATVGFTEIENIHSAAKIYADILAEKEFGESYSALVHGAGAVRGVSHDKTLTEHRANQSSEIVAARLSGARPIH